jgi:zinc protease
MERTLKNQILISILDQVLDIVYTEKVREEEGGTYGVSTGGSIARYPEGQTLLQILFDTDPDTERMEQLNEIILNELKGIAANGPRESDFTKVKEYLNKSYNENLKENSYWLGILSTKYFYGEDNHSSYIETVNAITPQEIQAFTAKLLDQGNVKTVIMVPETKE